MFSLWSTIWCKNSEDGCHSQVIRLATGVSERTIRRLGANHPTGTNDLNFRKSRNVGRPSTAQQHEQTVGSGKNLASQRMGRSSPVKYSLASKPWLQVGGKSAVYDLVRRIRPHETKPPVVRFEGLPGEFRNMTLVSDRSLLRTAPRKSHFFASRLKYSARLMST